ncbi:MAG TPA: hypothetical protein VEC94_03515 [Pseudolabrys sp.]|nr:hypothetical protein [Pseudolabrys sp.]
MVAAIVREELSKINTPDAWAKKSQSRTLTLNPARLKSFAALV